LLSREKSGFERVPVGDLRIVVEVFGRALAPAG
jgi:hypothetical protein